MAAGKYEYWITEDGLLLLSSWARNGLTDMDIAHNIGVSRQTIAKWKVKYSVIRGALKRNKEIVDIIVENALYKRAIGYEFEEVTQERLVNAAFQKMRGSDHVVKLTEDDWGLAQKFFDFECAYCGEKKAALTKDHFIPLNKGGELSKRNTVPCCQRCNSSKNDTDIDKWYKAQSFYLEERRIKIEFYLKAMGLQYEKDMGALLTEDLHVTKIVKKQVAPDVTAQIFWLKNRNRKDWRNQPAEFIETDNSNQIEQWRQKALPNEDEIEQIYSDFEKE